MLKDFNNNKESKMEQPKPWYLSKAILLNMLMGFAMIVGVFSPAVAAFIQEYFKEMGMGWGLLNIIIRLITKKEIGA